MGKRKSLAGATALDVLESVGASASGLGYRPEGPAQRTRQGKPLDLAVVQLDPDIQIRARIDQETVFSYAQDMLDGQSFPPIVVFADRGQFYVADGFHRALARALAGRTLSLSLDAGEVSGPSWLALAADLETIDCEVREGSRRDAILYAVGANDSHGLRRTRADKENAVLRLLNDPDWRQLSQNEIARLAGVTPATVGNIARRHGLEGQGVAGVVVGADGRAQQTGGQGRPRDPAVTARKLIAAWATGRKEPRALAELTEAERDATRAAIDAAIDRLQKRRATI